MNLYREWYSVFDRLTAHVAEGKVIEIGSGGGFLKEVYPRFITSDIMPLTWCDVVLPAEKLPYQQDDLGAIVMLNVLHHIPEPRKFFAEAQRTLAEGGKLIMIDKTILLA